MNIIEEAVVDAKLIKEAAMKMAEKTILEKYAQQVRQSFNKLLEAEMPPDPEGKPESGKLSGDDFSFGDDQRPPPDGGASDEELVAGGQAGPSDEEEPETINPADPGTKEMLKQAGYGHEAEAEGTDIDFNRLYSMIVGNDLEDEPEPEMAPGTTNTPPPPMGEGGIAGSDVQPDEDLILGEEPIGFDEDEELVFADQAQDIGPIPGEDDEDQLPPEGGEGTGGFFDDFSFDDEDPMSEDDLLNAINEVLEIDAEEKSDGWLGATSQQEQEALALRLAKLVHCNHKLEKEKEIKETELEKAVAGMEEKSEQLAEATKKIKSLEKNLNEMKLLNKKLLVINETLKSNSLNERQKKEIVEAVNGTSDADKIQVLSETLKHSMGGNTGRKSLSEVLESKPKGLVARANTGAREEKMTAMNPEFQRMQLIAGIKK